MHDSTWMTDGPRSWPRMRTRLLMAAGVLTVLWLLATACTRATRTPGATPPVSDVVTEEPAKATWQGPSRSMGSSSMSPPMLAAPLAPRSAS
jgi:hypothetical protein